MAVTGTDEPVVDNGLLPLEKIESSTEQSVGFSVIGPASNEDRPSAMVSASVSQSKTAAENDSLINSDADENAKSLTHQGIDAPESSAENPVREANSTSLKGSEAVRSQPRSFEDSSSSTLGQFDSSGIADSTTLDITGSQTQPDLIKSALVSKVLKKAREAAAESDQRSTGSTAYLNQKSTGSTRLSDQRTTGSGRGFEQNSTGATPGMSSQRSTGATQRVPDQRSTGATPRTSDQRSTGATPRISDQRSTGATPRISDQRSTGATPVYEDISTTGTFRSLIGRTPEGGAKTAGEQSEQDSDEAAPERSRKSLTATIEVEAQKSKVNFFEKLITRHPIIVGTVAFCVLVLPVYAVIVNSQSPAARAEYKQTLSKDLKIMASKLGKPGEYKGHKVAFYANRADAYMKSAEYQLAIGDLKIARLIDPAKSGTYNAKLSDCYIAVKDYKNAVAASAEIIKSDQSDVDALLQHAKSSYLLGNTLTALEDYFKAVKLDPSNPEVFIARGDYYLSEKKLGSAAADYKHALELAPSLAEAKRKLAASTLVVRRTASVDSAEVTAKLSPAALKMIGEADLATLKAKGYEALKKSDNLFAIAALSRAVSLAPNDALVRQYLAYAFLANENFADAVTQFNAWDKIATLKLPEKLAFARRLPAGSESCAAFYEQLIKQNSKDVQDLITIANACKLNGCQTQFEEAVDAGIKVGTPAEVAQLNTMKVAKAAEAKAAATAAKGTIAN